MIGTSGGKQTETTVPNDPGAWEWRTYFVVLISFSIGLVLTALSVIDFWFIATFGSGRQLLEHYTASWEATYVRASGIYVLILSVVAWQKQRSADRPQISRALSNALLPLLIMPFCIYFIVSISGDLMEGYPGPRSRVVTGPIERLWIEEKEGRKSARRHPSAKLYLKLSSSSVVLSYSCPRRRRSFTGPCDYPKLKEFLASGDRSSVVATVYGPSKIIGLVQGERTIIDVAEQSAQWIFDAKAALIPLYPITLFVGLGSFLLFRKAHRLASEAEEPELGPPSRSGPLNRT